MQNRSLLRMAALGCILLLAAPGFAQKKPLTLADYDGWNSIRNATLTEDGRWLLYTINPQEGDGRLEIRSVQGSTVHVMPRGTNPSFSRDGRFVVATIVPPFAEARQARIDKKPAHDQPKNTLLILDLRSGEKTEIERVTSFQMAERDSGWILYRPEPPRPEPARPAARREEPAKPAEGEKQEEKKEEEPKSKKKSDHRPGEVHVLRHLESGKEERIEGVVSPRFTKEGDVLVYAVSTKDGAGDGIVFYDLPRGEKRDVMKGLGRYNRFALHDDTKRVAFLTDRDDYEAKQSSYSLFLFDPQTGRTEKVAGEKTAGLPEGWWVSENGGVRFSDKGSRILFGGVPRPEEEKPNETPEDERVNVDVWHWQDDVLQPQQLLQARAERNRTFDAVYDIAAKKIVVLGDEDLRTISISQKGDGPWAIGRSDRAHRRAASWGEGANDFFLIDVATGARRPIVEGFNGGLAFSPGGRYIFGYDQREGRYLVIDPRTLETRNVSEAIPFPVVNELHDSPSLPGAYGTAGWTEDDRHVLIYDRYDIWMVDPSGRDIPVNITGGNGRNRTIRYRYTRVDPEEEFLRPGQAMLLSGLCERTKRDGYYRMALAPRQSPQALIEGPKRYNFVTKARDADVVVMTQEDIVEFPDLCLTNLAFESPRKVTDANPQQKEFNWSTAELITWMSNDGDMLQGILVKPEDFDPTKKYPLIAYFYERLSDSLYQYRAPAPSASTVNIPTYASNGYIIFIPDIPYKIGYPGESAVSAVIPGVHEVVRRGFVDPKRMGIQGQSWGGYQVTYLVTETNMFAAACAGAPVGNMFSAYGGIRWGSGLVRQFQYEKTQSRIDGTPWNATLRYIENSPLFFMDKVQTPLLIMHNDKDGAVPWYQGIEIFTALRRLDKPSWLIVYNEEDHNLVHRRNRKDWTQRMQGFFDHYLKGEPMPVWMERGVPAIDKGRNFGFEVPGR
jgi:dipeptidyl aminopeptidase/acylaminoacyl peptidase